MMRKSGFYIDKLTNSIQDAFSGISYETEVIPLMPSDLKTVLKKFGWNFNWRKEFTAPARKVYKLMIKADTEIQGLISLEPRYDQCYIEMHLIEAAPQNIGKSKRYFGVPGNLAAFGCKMSFDMGFEGFVAFTAKTLLIEHYIETLGATLIYRNRMSISGQSAKKLVNLYYKNYFDGK